MSFSLSVPEVWGWARKEILGMLNSLFLASHHPLPHPVIRTLSKLSELAAPENLTEEAARALRLVVLPQPLLFPGRF